MASSRKARGPRRSIQQPGWLILEGNFAARPCTVHDLSDNGAKITASEPGTVSARFRLALSRDVRTGRPCEIIWQRGKTFGVKFI
ncbi:PilZ domain-containing protein [Bradyrhizobium sp. LHD-71]|uniref:PilZ domain-containing protein n=1 Tax=Bradyrhizobium sp. LHD-71 TaxID=3072141 RepID=UPI00280C4E2E|nr:PilZ domain-containing protein [Bradyrhizobium sp. LHD-71]MDQ8726317.1 PilZ domain-containing protein [Bradyrhizobium sp. LHD-71]